MRQSRESRTPPGEDAGHRLPGRGRVPARTRHAPPHPRAATTYLHTCDGRVTSIDDDQTPRRMWSRPRPPPAVASHASRATRGNPILPWFVTPPTPTRRRLLAAPNLQARRQGGESTPKICPASGRCCYRPSDIGRSSRKGKKHGLPVPPLAAAMLPDPGLCAPESRRYLPSRPRTQRRRRIFPLLVAGTHRRPRNHASIPWF